MVLANHKRRSPAAGHRADWNATSEFCGPAMFFRFRRVVFRVHLVPVREDVRSEIGRLCTGIGTLWMSVLRSRNGKAGRSRGSSGGPCRTRSLADAQAALTR